MHKRLIIIPILVVLINFFCPGYAILSHAEVMAGDAAETASPPDKIVRDDQDEKRGQTAELIQTALTIPKRFPPSQGPQPEPQPAEQPEIQTHPTPEPPQQVQPPQVPAQQQEQPQSPAQPQPDIKEQTQQFQPVQTPTPQPEPQPAAQPQPQVSVPHQTLQKPAMKKGEVSFNFDDADVFSVIQTIFGDVLKVNYIVDPRVKGRVNFRSVAPVAKEDVLPLMETILRLNGIGIVEEGGLYRIVPIGDMAKEPASVGIGRESESIRITGKALLQIVPINYIQSTEMVRILTPFLSSSAVIMDVPRSNHIVIIDTDANVKRLMQLVEIFDGENLKQTKPQVFVYPVQNGKAKDVAALLQQIFFGPRSAAAVKTPAPLKTPSLQTPSQQQTTQQQAQASATTGGDTALLSDIARIIPDEGTNSIVILSTPEDYALIAETIKKIDILPRQVVIEGLIARVDLTDNLSFGLSWSLNTDVNFSLKPFTRDFSLGGDVTSTPFGTDLDSSAGSGFTFVGSDPSGIVRAKLSAALNDSKAKILASPHILVSDNREARIQVGSQIPLATSTTTTPIGGTAPTNTTTSTVQYKDIGIILKVKPQVNDSGLISLEISQEVSSLGDNVKLADQQFASINKTETTTNLVAQDGETIIIGGLIREDITKSTDGIPLLSKIPILGLLFSNTTDNTTRTELIILLTPHVVKNQQEAGSVTSDYLNRFKEDTKMKLDVPRKKEKGDKDNGSKGPGQDKP